MQSPKLNKIWHAAHRMPPRATLEQRIEWHLEHRQHCGCRPIPEKLAAVMKERGLLDTSDTITFDTVRELALAFPGAEESTSYGTPAIKVRGKLFVRLHQSGDAIVVQISPEDRAMRMRADPQAFFITDHYTNYPLMLVRFASVFRDDLQALLEDSWRRVAPNRLIAEYDG